jgi:hypothetical protein
MIGHELNRSGSFWSFLLSIDKDLADSARQKGCSCGGRLHCAVTADGPEQSADQDDVMVDDHPQRMRRHRF